MKRKKKIDTRGTIPLLVALGVIAVGRWALLIYMESVSPGGWL